MRIVGKKVLTDFLKEHPDCKHDCEQPLKAWHAEMRNNQFRSPHEVKTKYGSASMVGDNRVVFNIGGNKYRLVVLFNYDLGIAQIRFMGTHREYDGIKAETV